MGAIAVLTIFALTGSVVGQSTRSESVDLVRAQRFETEPNDHWMDSSPITNNHYGTGDISPEGDIDWWGSGYGYQSIVFAYCDTGSSVNRDSQLGVYHDDWFTATLIEFDDDDGPGLSSCIAGASVPETGRVSYRVNDYQDNGEISPYDLHQHITIEQGMEEREPNNDSGSANGLDIMVHQQGSLPPGDPADWYVFHARAGDLLVIIMDDDPDDDGNLLDTEVAIVANDGSTVLAEGDNGAGDGNCLGALFAPVHGDYYVRVSDGGGGDGDVDYRFVLLVNGVLVPVELQNFSIE